MFHTERASVCRVPRVEESLMPGMNSKAGMAGAQGASTGVAGGKAPDPAASSSRTPTPRPGRVGCDLISPRRQIIPNSTPETG